MFVRGNRIRLRHENQDRSPICGLCKQKGHFKLECRLYINMRKYQDQDQEVQEIDEEEQRLKEEERRMKNEKEKKEKERLERQFLILFLFDFILYVHSTIFQLFGTGLPGLNQY